MKGQGLQEGTVRTYWVLPVPSSPLEGSQPAHRLDSPPTARLYAKVRLKPINHSKFTGKCGKAQCIECQMGPVVHGRTGSNFVALSASGLLDHLAHESNDSDESYDHEYDASDDDDVSDGDPWTGNSW
ncbi:hypothetical protein CRG98_045590 [Punica granatum]|uniref:Uncharacterized protein n=1 Tax=Punica granatum TaxID=22663 RepID=A0A2I0HRE4_PUNGR|nr:hypothetical protein CRG98_045590 [Punica granatum]